MSEELFRTTHVGSLPRPDNVLRAIYGRLGSDEDVTKVLDEAVADAVRKQAAAGLDEVSDGEMAKMSYAHYVASRLTGLGPGGSGLVFWDLQEAGLGMRFVESGEVVTVPEPLACVASIGYAGHAALDEDIARFKRALEEAPGVAGFMTAASPGVVELFFENKFYGNHADYVGALGEALRNEYEAITGAGLLLQIDCPDLAAGWHVTKGRRWSKEDFLQLVRENIAAINDATANIAPEQMRLHLCWGNYEGPHDLDFPLMDLVEEVSRARPATISVEGSNPRHGFEVEAWQRLAENGKTVALGVIDTSTTFVEHPQLVARRAIAASEAIGPERLILSADCGFGTWAGLLPAIPEVVAWRKLEALSEGAKLVREAMTGVPAAV